MNKHDTIVIGGGASGMLAAIIAKDYGQDVAIIESGNRVGRKLLTTGNGRCNITNRKIKSPYLQHHSFNTGFHQSVLDQCTVDDTLELFYRLGLPIIELTKGRMYPQSLQAASVIDILRLNLEERNIPVYLESKVKMVLKKNDQFNIQIAEQNEEYSCDRLIIATGGISATKTGSDGSIQPILKRFGHTFTPLLPSIVQLKLNYPRLNAITGVRFDARVRVLVDGKEVRSDFDEVLFTNYGISGPAILQVSREASIGLYNKKDVQIVLDLFDHLSDEELQDFFENHFFLFPERRLIDVFNGIIHKKLIPIILKDAGINDLHQTAEMLSYPDKANLYRLFKSWTFNCMDTNGFHHAQATIGGVDTTDVDPDTLESKLVKNLYFSGEVIDVDGDCGGYNLQWAWSSAYVSGKASKH